MYKSKWNQLSLERKQGNGSWGVIGQVDIQWNKLETLYFDSAGDDSYSYRFRFTNTQTQIFTEYSPTVSGAGFGNLQVGQMIMNTRRKIRDPNRQRFSDQDIIAFLQQAQMDIQMRLPKLWFLQVNTFETGIGIPTVASQDVYSLASYTDLLYLYKLRFKYINGANTLLYDLIPTAENEFDRYNQNQNQVLDDNAIRIKLLPPTITNLQGSFKVYPIPRNAGAGTFYPVYYRKFTPLNDVSDTTDLPFPEILEDYAAYRLHQLMGNQTQSAVYKKLYSGPNDGSNEEPLTGIALLEVHNKNVMNVSTGYGKQMWKYRGKRGRNNFFGNGMINADYRRENYF